MCLADKEIIEVLETIVQHGGRWGVAAYHAINELKSKVPIVMCSECKFWDDKSGLTARKCTILNRVTVQRFYCAHGKRWEVQQE